MPAVNITILETAIAESSLGLFITFDHVAKNVVVSKVKNAALESNVQINDQIIKINGTKVEDMDHCKSLIMESEHDFNLDIYRPLNFQDMVKEEFGYKFFVRTVVGNNGNTCIITYKDNAGDCMAICCPACDSSEQYEYSLILLGGVKVTVRDNLEDKLMRSPWNPNASHAANASKARRVANMTTAVTQKVSRIEAVLINDKMAAEKSDAPTIAVATDVAIAIPEAEVIVREDNSSLVDEIEKLKGFLEDGTLTQEEFDSAKSKLLS